MDIVVPTKEMTLCLIRDKDRILLGKKKRGFGEGKYNGFGGKLFPGETPEQALVREVYEESGLKLLKYIKRGVLTFFYQKNNEIFLVHIFEGLEWSGEPTESDEAIPEWFSLDSLPFGLMWPNDVHWIPLFLEGSYFQGEFHFNEEYTIDSFSLKTL